MWDTCTSYFGPKKFDRVGRGGQRRSKYGPEMGLAIIYFWPWSLLEAPKWVKDPGNGLKSIRGSWGTIFAWVVSRRWERLSPLKRYRLITGGGGSLPLKR